MTTTIITASTWAYDDPTQEVIIAESAKPFLAAAGYVHRDQLANTPAPVVLDLEEA